MNVGHEQEVWKGDGSEAIFKSQLTCIWMSDLNCDGPYCWVIFNLSVGYKDHETVAVYKWNMFSMSKFRTLWKGER